MATVEAGLRNEDGDPTIAVYGLGKMGLPLAAVLADTGFDVLGVDIDEVVTTAVNSGESPVSEPGLDELVQTYGGDKLEATTEGSRAAARADVMILLVPTVLDDHNDPNLDPVMRAAADISEGLTDGDLVILESTVPPKTTSGPFTEALETESLTAGEDFGLAHCPERTYSGRVITDLTESYPKIVGGVDEDSTAAASALYQRFNAPGVIELGSATAAEAVKVFEGVYRDTNIALANELGMVCEDWELDAHEVFEAANTQPFCDIHVPGIGVGGHCIPVYPHFVIGGSRETPLLETARAVNDRMPGHAVDILAGTLAGHGCELSNATILVLGITYRPGVKELRYAPALDLVKRLREEGAKVFAHDPLIDDETMSEIGAKAVHSPIVQNIDGVVLATGHEQYRDLNLSELRDAMRTPVFVDGRAFFDPEEMEAFTYAQIANGETET
ncbi:nucleotide sugar dehydrogenase [Halobellus captivus]|uniref:nucleotide sugar dehydrogenase n=1 Tax=Halobellus captivus TaxID=2592614 RepID=UPI0011A76B20|nr:nucleotide sugar dehydrogenase [Halobellus captivus]